MAGFFEAAYKIQQASRSGYETRVNAMWVKNTGVKGKKIQHIFDGIYVLIPPGFTIDRNKLREAVSYEEPEQEESEEK